MKKQITVVIFGLLLTAGTLVNAVSEEYSEKIFLWRGFKGMETQLRDTVLYYFEPEGVSADATVPAVIICPGGSYNHLGLKSEGFSTARWFKSKGTAAFVLQYRVGYNEHHYPDMLQDFQRAITYVRENAEKYNVKKNKIGGIGFSAGGHLVTMAGEFADSHNELEKMGFGSKESVRPDFCMPIYPVVTMDDDIGHKWSRKSLLGHVYRSPKAAAGFGLFNIRGFKYSQEYKDEFSMEKNVPANMPPTFLLACEDDPVVIFENSIRLDKALSAAGIDHIFVNYPKGGHGFGMQPESYIIKTYQWNEKDLLPWLMEKGFFK